MTTTDKRLSLLKSTEQDFEWYPTTDEMIQVVFLHCFRQDDYSSILDIGAGDGRVLEKIDRLNFDRLKKKREWREFRSTIDKYAIEKSQIHIENMPQDISIVGTDFNLQTLIDKKVDIVFCNPPYSEYEDWVVKIIKQANAKRAYLVLPARWSESKIIEQAIKQRKALRKVIWSGDFLTADRKARAKVDILEIIIDRYDNNRYDDKRNIDPFDIWFEEYFSGFDRLKPVDDEEKYKPKHFDFGNKIVEGQNLIERLHSLYTKEMKGMLDNYATLSNLDADLLKEIGVQVFDVKKALKNKIEGLKNKYWQELFNHLAEITKRLTSNSRTAILEKLNASCNVDFSPENAYAIVIWAIKNTNKYIDSQVIEIFKELTEPDCVKNYKSNLKTWGKDGWHYSKNDMSHYALDYRIVSQQWTAICNDEYSSYDYPNGLSKGCHDFINDVCTIANNLGFANSVDTHRIQWEAGKTEEFYYRNGKPELQLLFDVKAYKNGNLHFRLNQNFIKTFNIEASRLLGWIKTPEEATKEMDIDLSFARSKFRSNLLIGTSEGQKLLVGVAK